MKPRINKKYPHQQEYFEIYEAIISGNFERYKTAVEKLSDQFNPNQNHEQIFGKSFAEKYSDFLSEKDICISLHTLFGFTLAYCKNKEIVIHLRRHLPIDRF